MDVFCKSGVVSCCDESPDYVALHPGYELCSSVDVVFNNLRSFAFFADKYSLCGQGVIMGLPTVFGENPKINGQYRQAAPYRACLSCTCFYADKKRIPDPKIVTNSVQNNT